MNKFHNRPSTPSVYKHRTLIASLAVLLIGGVGFAATGGTETVKRIFVTLRLAGPNGEEVQGVVLEMLDNGEGGTVTLDLKAEDGQAGTLTVERLGVEGDDAGAGIILTKVNIDTGTGDADAVNATILSRDGESASMTIDVDTENRQLRMDTIGAEGEASGEAIIVTNVEKVNIGASEGETGSFVVTILAREGESASATMENTDTQITFKTLTITLGEMAEDVAAVAVTLSDEETGEQQRTMLQAVTSTDGAGTTTGAFTKLQIMPKETLLRQMDESEAVAEWVDDEGVVQEMFVLPRVSDEPSAAGFHIVVAHFDENGERAFRMVGNMTGLDPETADFTEIEWGEDNQPTLLFVTDEGREISLRVDLDGAMADRNVMIHVEIKEDGETRLIRDGKNAPDRR